MKKIFAFLIVLLGFLLLAPSVSAQACPYQSTQARVQNNITTPWSPSITVGCEKSFNVGSFHSGIDRFATDTNLQVIGPNGYAINAYNGQTVFVPNPGTYQLFVSTAGQFTAGCSEVATVNVVCAPPPPPVVVTQPVAPVVQAQSPSCPYGSTQARMQKDINDPWKQSMSISCGERFNVGSFHNHTGQFATDTQVRVIGPSILPFNILRLDHNFANAQGVRALFPGTYILRVTTPGKSGGACEEEARVEVSCPILWWQI